MCITAVYRVRYLLVLLLDMLGSIQCCVGTIDAVAKVRQLHNGVCRLKPFLIYASYFV